MLMLCSSAGGTHSVFVRAVGVVATFLLLLSERTNSKIKGRMVLGQSGGLSRPGHTSKKCAKSSLACLHTGHLVSSPKGGITLNLAGDSPWRGKELQASSDANFLREKEPSVNITAIESQPPGLGRRSLYTLLPFSCECSTQALSLLSWIASTS